jgi:hypothetical protein
MSSNITERNKNEQIIYESKLNDELEILKLYP